MVSYDRRGRGESKDTKPYAVEREVEDVAALLDHFGGHGYVVGASSGAVLGLRCVLAGLPVDALVCYEPPFVTSGDRPAVSSDYADRLDAEVAAGRPGEAVKLFMTEAVGMPAAMVEPMAGLPFWPALEQLAHTLVYDAHVMGDTMRGRPEALDAFASAAVPTLVATGAASEPWLHEAARRLTDRLPNATASTLPGQAHDVDPVALADVVGSYFAPLRAGAGTAR